MPCWFLRTQNEDYDKCFYVRCLPGNRDFLKCSKCVLGLRFLCWVLRFRVGHCARTATVSLAKGSSKASLTCSAWIVVCVTWWRQCKTLLDSSPCQVPKMLQITRLSPCTIVQLLVKRHKTYNTFVRRFQPANPGFKFWGHVRPH